MNGQQRRYYGMRNSRGELHTLARRPMGQDTEQEARRLAALVPGAVAVEWRNGVWRPLPADTHRCLATDQF
jgi:hypothetical protein